MPEEGIKYERWEARQPRGPVAICKGKEERGDGRPQAGQQQPSHTRARGEDSKARQSFHVSLTRPPLGCQQRKREARVGEERSCWRWYLAPGASLTGMEPRGSRGSARDRGQRRGGVETCRGRERGGGNAVARREAGRETRPGTGGTDARPGGAGRCPPLPRRVAPCCCHPEQLLPPPWYQ